MLCYRQKLVILVKKDSQLCECFCSFQFETETEGTKLRRDVLAEGNVSSGGAPSGIISILSGQEEMFAFRRAVSGFPCPALPCIYIYMCVCFVV